MFVGEEAFSGGVANLSQAAEGLAGVLEQITAAVLEVETLQDLDADAGRADRVAEGQVGINAPAWPSTSLTRPIGNFADMRSQKSSPTQTGSDWSNGPHS